MTKKRFSEQEMLKGMNPHNSHADELAATDNADSDFLLQRDDVIDVSRIELEEDEQTKS